MLFSSSGVKAVDKRVGSGSHNWGTYEDDMKAEQDQANTSTDDAGQTTGKNWTFMTVWASSGLPLHPQ